MAHGNPPDVDARTGCYRVKPEREKEFRDCLIKLGRVIRRVHATKTVGFGDNGFSRSQQFDPSQHDYLTQPFDLNSLTEMVDVMVQACDLPQRVDIQQANLPLQLVERYYLLT